MPRNYVRKTNRPYRRHVARNNTCRHKRKNTILKEMDIISSRSAEWRKWNGFCLNHRRYPAKWDDERYFVPSQFFLVLGCKDISARVIPPAETLQCRCWCGEQFTKTLSELLEPERWHKGRFDDRCDHCISRRPTIPYMEHRYHFADHGTILIRKEDLKRNNSTWPYPGEYHHETLFSCECTECGIQYVKSAAIIAHSQFGFGYCPMCWNRTHQYYRRVKRPEKSS